MGTDIGEPDEKEKEFALLALIGKKLQAAVTVSLASVPLHWLFAHFPIFLAGITHVAK